jgi:hypothetical protein
MTISKLMVAKTLPRRQDKTRQTDGRTDGWTDRWTDGPTNRRTDQRILQIHKQEQGAYFIGCRGSMAPPNLSKVALSPT